jgi:hypothetical protein
MEQESIIDWNKRGGGRLRRFPGGHPESLAFRLAG